jgi:hypothetical protein
MADLWYPGGVPDPAPPSVWGSFTDSGEPKFLLHTTEGHLGAYHPDPNTGAGRRYYGNTGTWPNYTLAWNPIWKCWSVYNHIPANRSSLSLRNRPGGVQTNRDCVTQIEIATRAAEIRDLPHAAMAALAALLAWEHVTRGVPLASTVRWVAYPASYGERAPQRLSGPAWDAYAGVLGHQHAPENDHGDPGDFPVQALLALARDHLSPPPPPPEDDVPKPSEWDQADRDAIGAAFHDYLWRQMQARPHDAPEDWHPPKEFGVGGVLRRSYEMIGEVLAPRAPAGARASEPLSIPGLLDGVYAAGGTAALVEIAMQATALLAQHLAQPLEEEAPP